MFGYKLKSYSAMQKIKFCDYLLHKKLDNVNIIQSYIIILNKE